MGSKYVTISVKIPKEIKEKLEKAGISPSKVVKKALMDIAKEIEKFEHILAKIPAERVVKSIREDRER